jgi:HEAT repeat protein
MADRFRLIHFKSTDSERMTSPAAGLTLAAGDRASAGASPSSQGPDGQETISSRTVLNQAKADLKHPDPRVRILSLQYLEKIEASLAVPLLREAVSDPDSRVRGQAVRSLIRFREPGLTPLLRRCLRDSDPGVRMGALRGIFLSGEGIDSNLLLQLLSDESPWVRRKLATLLGWTPMEGVLPILSEMSKDQDARVRKAALLSLMTLYPEEGRERLFEAYNDEEPEIRLWAKKTLENWVAQSATK